MASEALVPLMAAAYRSARGATVESERALQREVEQIERRLAAAEEVVAALREYVTVGGTPDGHETCATTPCVHCRARAALARWDGERSGER